MNAPRIYAFDLYGTLVDYASLRERVAPFAPDPDAFVAAWRAKQLAYCFAASAMDRYVDFDTITLLSLRYVLATVKRTLADDALHELAAAWSSLPAFADAAETLAGLRARGISTAVLSNGTPAALARTLAETKLADACDAVLSVDAVRRYKPHPSAYALATKHFGVAASEIGFVSSNGWDATGAAEFGFSVAWCNRSGAPPETFGAAPTRIIPSLRALLD